MTERFEEVERGTLEALALMIRRARGHMVTFKVKKVAKIAGLSTKPVDLTQVREVLEQLRCEGLIQLYKATSKGVRYMVTSESPLWQYLRVNPLPPSLSELVKVVKGGEWDGKQAEGQA